MIVLKTQAFAARDLTTANGITILTSDAMPGSPAIHNVGAVIRIGSGEGGANDLHADARILSLWLLLDGVPASRFDFTPRLDTPEVQDVISMPPFPILAGQVATLKLFSSNANDTAVKVAADLGSHDLDYLFAFRAAEGSPTADSLVERLKALDDGTAVVSADVVEISGDEEAADALETVLDGTGGAVLKAAQLKLSCDVAGEGALDCRNPNTNGRGQHNEAGCVGQANVGAHMGQYNAGHLGQYNAGYIGQNNDGDYAGQQNLGDYSGQTNYGSTAAVQCIGSPTYPPTPDYWEATTAYTLDEVVRPDAWPDVFHYKCVVAGTSGSSEPTWPTTLGDTVEDGGSTPKLKWECIAIETAVGEGKALTLIGAADVIDDILADTADMQPRFAGITVLANWLRGLFRKLTMDATAKGEVNLGGGTFNEATDSEEALGEKMAAVKAKTDTIGAADLTAVSPVLEDGDLEIVQGDDYMDADGRALEWTDTAYTGPIQDGDDAEFALMETADYHAAGGTPALMKAGTAHLVGTTLRIVVELTAAETAALEPSPPDDRMNYTYQVRVDVGSSGSGERQVTAALGAATVKKKVVA